MMVERYLASLLVSIWIIAINTIWYMVRQFHKSKPPGRQTVVYSFSRSHNLSFWKVLSDIVCAATYLLSLNVSLTGSVFVYKILGEHLGLPLLSCNVLSSLVYLWETSLIALEGMGTCLRSILIA